MGPFKKEEMRENWKEKPTEKNLDIATDGAIYKQHGKKTKPEKEQRDETDKVPEERAISIKAETRWEVEKFGPTRIMERKRLLTKRYGIDVMKIDKESDVYKRTFGKKNVWKRKAL